MHKHQGSSKSSSRGCVQAPVPVWLKCWWQRSLRLVCPQITHSLCVEAMGGPVTQERSGRSPESGRGCPACRTGHCADWVVCEERLLPRWGHNCGTETSACATQDCFQIPSKCDSSRFQNKKLELPAVLRNSWNHGISYVLLNFIYMQLNSKDDYNGKLFL